MAGHRILLIGIDPDAVDYSQPGTPPGLNATTAKEGRNQVINLFERQGDNCDLCELHPDLGPSTELRSAFSSKLYDCVLIGGGLRVPETTLSLFETVIDEIRRYAPGTPIAFNTSIKDSVAADARRLG